jgi:hypothetical protein
MFSHRHSFYTSAHAQAHSLAHTTSHTHTSMPTRLQLDAELGWLVLIKNLRILTGTGILIEEVQDYNILANVISCYDTDTNIRNKKSLTEGTTLYNPLCRTDADGSNVLELSPYNYTNHSCGQLQFYPLLYSG